MSRLSSPRPAASKASRLASAFIHPTAEIAPSALIGPETRIWHHCQIMDSARVGSRCVLGKGVYVDRRVQIGNNCKLQNYVSVYRGFEIEDGVFLGPGVMLLNDKRPRAINPDGSLKSDADWSLSVGRVKCGASIGGGAVVLPGVVIGCFALVGAGSVVTRDVIDYGLVYGNPARLCGMVCTCGQPLALPVDGRCPPECPGCGGSIMPVIKSYQTARERDGAS